MEENEDDTSYEESINSSTITNIEYQEEELKLKYRELKIIVNISMDNNFIKLICSPKNKKSEIYQYIMNRKEFLEIFKETEKNENEISAEFYFTKITKLFKDRKVKIIYDNNLYNLSLILLLENEIELIFGKKINISNFEFKNNPNLKFKETILTTNFGGGCNSIFEAFLSYKDSKQYIASSNYTNYNIDIIYLDNNQLISSLIGHKNEIYSIRYFLNEISKEEFLISSDAYKKVIVWNIQKDFNIKFSITVNYSNFRDIYSCMITNIDEYNYVIISSYTTNKNISNKNPENDCTKMYSLMNGGFIKNIYNTNNNCTRYLLSWYNEQNNNVYIIECCDNKITINNLLKKENYCDFESEIEGEEFLSGFIYSKNNIDYLCTGSWNGYIRLWNLYEKNEFNSVKSPYCELYHIISWTNKYALIANKFINYIMVINVDTLEIISKIKDEFLNGIKCIKKVIHPKYGESLITCGEDGNINLYEIFIKIKVK